VTDCHYAMSPSPHRSPFRIQQDVIYALLLRELSSQFGKSRGGFLWVLVEPVAHLLLPVFIFSFIRQRMVPGVEFPVYLVYGFMPFLLFKGMCMQIIDGVNHAQGLLSYRQVLLMDVFIAKAMAMVAVQAIVYAIVLSCLNLLGYDVLPDAPIEVGATLLLTALLAFGLGLLFAAMVSVSPDARAIVRVMFMPLYFISGILFPITNLPDAWVRLLAINPVLHIVQLTRHAAFENFVPMQYLRVEYPIALALATTAIGLMLYRLRFMSRVTQ